MIYNKYMVGIFSTSQFFNSYNLSHIRNDIIFDEFANELAGINIILKFIISINEKNSPCARTISQNKHKVEPALSLYVQNYNDIIKYRINENDTNWDGKFYFTEKIIKTWIKLCKKNNLNKTFYSKNMFVFIHNALKKELIDLTYFCKDDIKKYFLNTKPECKMKYVFCSSEPEPTIKVLFKDFDTLKKEIKENNIEEYRKAINEIIKQKDYNLVFDENIKIIFLDVENEKNKIYGYSRED